MANNFHRTLKAQLLVEALKGGEQVFLLTLYVAGEGKNSPALPDFWVPTGRREDGGYSFPCLDLLSELAPSMGGGRQM